MPSCYILYSEKIDKFYIGSTSIVIDDRLVRHNSGYYDSKWSEIGIPWILFLNIECTSLRQAKSIEAHLKRMKSRKYISNLAVYPDIIVRLKEKYIE